MRQMQPNARMRGDTVAQPISQLDRIDGNLRRIESGKDCGAELRSPFLIRPLSQSRDDLGAKIISISCGRLFTNHRMHL